jgi:hypothetical protein
MQILTDLNANLLKTVNAVVIMKRFYQIITFELPSAVEAGGECRCFLLPVGARKQEKMLEWSHQQARWQWRLFYIMLL